MNMLNKFQLFCFTHGGGSASFFAQIEKDLSSLEVTTLEYAGHGTRREEPLCDNFSDLADDMFNQLRAAYKGVSYALFGYSMGTVVVFEVLRRILASVIPTPAHIFLAAHEPRTIPEVSAFTEGEFDSWIKGRILKMGTVPGNLIDNKVFQRMYLPLYKADYRLLGSYDFDDSVLETSIPAIIFYSEQDTPLAKMKQWEKYFKGSVEYKKYEGQHFFIQQHHEDMAKIIAEKIQECQKHQGHQECKEHDNHAV